ncbi:MAG TPA: SUMF1/EgtB/PvdO family nonheme iron enzyme [Candidatus Bilamarchaeum sp.]|nr:SUMF1/EgtB/PvdO family nonheme iron enzyme [Candidatus Bilamarchaeum sp.]
MHASFPPLQRSRAAARGRPRFAAMAVLVSLASCVDASGSVTGGNEAGSPLDATSAPDAGPAPAPLPAKAAGKQFDTGFTAGCPELMVRAGDFCIDRFEAFVVELRDGREIPHPHSLPPKGKMLRAKVAYNEFPQSSITMPDAEQACFNAGKRLCTLAEWVKACSGTGSFKYPYGNVETARKCNTRKAYILSELHGSNPRGWGDAMKDPMLNYVPGFLSRSGLYPECVSTYGAYDMVGNLHEWVSTLVDEQTAARPVIGKRDPRWKVVPGNGIFVGGFYSSGNQNGEGCRYMTTVHGPDQDDYSVGFRCCRDAGE